jgi:hypothetical protein
MAKTFPNECRLYVPGHRTHFIQVKVKAELPRFPAAVELIDPETVRVSYLGKVELLKTHNALDIQLNALNVVDDDITYCPEASLLHIKGSGPIEGMLGMWHIHYLTDKPLKDCASSDPNSGYFEVGV